MAFFKNVTNCFLCSYRFFPKKEGVFWGCLSLKCRRQILYILGFYVPLYNVHNGPQWNSYNGHLLFFFYVVWLFSFWAYPSPIPLFTTSKAVACCLSFTPRFPRLAGIWMYCLLLILVGEYSCLKLIFRNCCPICGFRRVDEGLKALDFDFSVLFFFSALVSVCRILLQSSKSLPTGSFRRIVKTHFYHSHFV